MSTSSFTQLLNSEFSGLWGGGGTGGGGGEEEAGQGGGRVQGGYIQYMPVTCK